jgi:hypothetical protein
VFPLFDVESHGLRLYYGYHFRGHEWERRGSDLRGVDAEACVESWRRLLFVSGDFEPG